jgi:hypothetical protein
LQSKNGNSAGAAAARLLRRVKPILERVKELQAQAAANAAETPEKLAGELNQVLAPQMQIKPMPQQFPLS